MTNLINTTAAIAALSAAVDSYLKNYTADDLRAIASAYNEAVAGSDEDGEIGPIISRLHGEEGEGDLDRDAAEFLANYYVTSADGVTLQADGNGKMFVGDNAGIEAEADEMDRENRRYALDDGEYLDRRDVAESLKIKIGEAVVDPKISIGPNSWEMQVFKTDRDGVFVGIAGGEEGPVRAGLFSEAEIDEAVEKAFRVSIVGDAGFAERLARALELVDPLELDEAEDQDEGEDWEDADEE